MMAKKVFPVARSLSLSAVFLMSALALSGCQSSEERAEGYFLSAKELLAAGDEDRAMIELRNVFKYNGFHQEARTVYADLLLERGDLREAYGQYLRLVEQYPDLPEARQTLAEMAIDTGNWSEVERHGEVAIRLAPDAPRSRAIALSLAYRTAALDRDDAARASLADDARALLGDLPDSLALRRMIIDQKISVNAPREALEQVDAVLGLQPENAQFHSMKLQILGGLGEMAPVGEQLKTMVALFPENQDAKQSLIRWFLAQKDNDGAEAFLRAEAGEATGAPEGHTAVVQFLSQIRGRDAARTELARLITANQGTPNADLYRSMLATMDFEDGKRDEAIAELTELVAGAEPSDQSRRIAALLAQMHDATGARPQAQELVAKILTEDASNVEALRLRAGWAIAEDRVGDAILDLRMAQGQAPRDPRIMTLLAAAFERDGSKDLAAEQLAKAVEASGSAPEDSLRYAQFLRRDGRDALAETVLTEARRVSPGNPAVLSALADVLLVAEKWPQAKEVAATLRQLGTPETLRAADQIDAALLLGQAQVEEGLAMLESQALSSPEDVRPTVLVVATQLRNGKAEAARTFLDNALQQKPGDATLRLLSANVDAVMGRTAEAEQVYRALIAERPTDAVPVRLLYALLGSLQRPDEAEAVLDAGLQQMPDDLALLAMKAGVLETRGDYAAAIEIYDRLYTKDSSNVVLANNLASMITSYLEDPESLERAAVIARRLRDTTVPAFQDTYGWIEYRRGNLEEALRYLEPAAKGLPQDPITQYHLGMLYADMGRKDEAVTQLRRALELGEGREIPQLERARARLEALTTAP